MELLLNLLWVLLTAFLFGLWVRSAPPGRASRRRQFIALSILILLLFPAISMTDDLQAAQNPAEADCCLRRGHGVGAHQSLVPIAAGPPSLIADVASAVWRLASPAKSIAPVFDCPAMARIQNRPPPLA